MPVVSDYLLKTSPAVIQANLFVRLVNNATGASYISDGVTDANGKFTHSVNPPPAGTYTVYTGAVGTIGGTPTATGDTNYIVPMVGYRVYNLATDYGLTDDGTDQSAKTQIALNAVAGIAALFVPPSPTGYRLLPTHPYSSQSDVGVACYLPSGTTIVGVGQLSLFYSDTPSGATGGFAFFENLGWGAQTAQSNIQITGVRIRRTVNMTGTTEGPYDGAIVLRNSSRIMIEDCIFEGGQSGVVIEGCADWEVARCRSYYAGDCSFRVPDMAQNPWPGHAIVEDCWSFNAGFSLADVALPGNGSAFISTQNSVTVRGGGAINPQSNAYETGPSSFSINPYGLVIDGYKAYADILGRSCSILVGTAQRMSIRDVNMEVHNGATGSIYLANNGGVGQSYIEIDGCNFFNDYTAASFEATAFNISNVSAQVVMRNCTSIRGKISIGAATSSDITVENCEVRLAAGRGFSIVGAAARMIIRRCRAFDCGNDTVGQAADYNRAGFMFDTCPGTAVDDCISLETRVGAARRQLYGFGTNGTAMTLFWNNNFTDGNNLNAPYLTTGTVTLASRAIVGLVAGQQLQSFQMAADANPRHLVTVEGHHEWGPGNAVSDVKLRRTAVNVMTLFGTTVGDGLGTLRAGHIQDDGGLLSFDVLGNQSVRFDTSTFEMVLMKGTQTRVITSGALPTVALVSTTGAQVSTHRDTVLALVYTTTTVAGTCKIELSPDNVTYSTLVTEAPGVVGTFERSIPVPSGWYIKVTVTNATLAANHVYY